MDMVFVLTSDERIALIKAVFYYRKHLESFLIYDEKKLNDTGFMDEYQRVLALDSKINKTIDDVIKDVL